jgi:AcrR family transcriptional regulator
MTTRGKVKRTYDSRLRAGQARTTRAALLEAAGRLFADQGYVATSIEQIAGAAGVARATVFTSVGGKPALLKGAYDVALVGDDLPIPLADRPESRGALQEIDPLKFLRMYAKIATGLTGRVSGINEAIRGAAGADIDARHLWETVQQERAVGAQHVIEALEKKTKLRAGLDRKTAMDIVWTLIEPGLYYQLVRQRGWSPEQFEKWLAEPLRTQLLPADRRKT